METESAFDGLRARWTRRVVIVMALLTSETGWILGMVRWPIGRDGFDVVGYARSDVIQVMSDPGALVYV
jgi:hypothetical protein